MSTSAVQITHCPPSYRPELEYDQHMTIQSKYPVSVKHVADGEVESPGLSWDDYRFMSTTTHKLDKGRRLERPIWATNDAALRRLLIFYVQSRAYMNNKPDVSGTEKERLDRALAVLAARRPKQEASLKYLCQEHRLLAASDDANDKARKRKLAIQIANLDTCLRFDSNIAAIVIGAVHGYYRRGLDSVAVAEELNLKSPHVRQLFWRLHKAWARLEQGWQPGTSGPKIRRARACKPFDIEQAAKLNAEGHTLEEIGTLFGCHATTVEYKLLRAGLYHAHPKGRRPGTLSAITEMATQTITPKKCPPSYRPELEYDHQRPQKKERKPFDIALAVKMYAAGQTLREIGKLFGCDIMTVRNNLLRAGLYNPRPIGRRPGTRNR